MYPPFSPAFQLGPLTIRWYGIIMVTAIFVGALLASRYVARRGQDSNTVWSLLLWVVIPAILGARLYYVFIQSPRSGPNGLDNYLAHPLTILAIWQGGIHIYGALIGGGIALLIYAAVKKLPVLIYLDAVALILPLSQAIGRLGNFMNQELYGPPTTLPWGLRIDPAYRIAPYNNLVLYPESTRFQPLFLYEMIWNLIGFALIFWLSRRLEKKLRSGDILLMYLIWYPLGRFFLEFFRTDSWFFPGTPFNLVHLLSAFVILASIVLLAARHLVQARQPAIALQAAGGSMDQFEEGETSVGEGIDMSVEYLFLKKRGPSGEKAEEPEQEQPGEKAEELEDEEQQNENEQIETPEELEDENLADPLMELALATETQGGAGEIHHEEEQKGKEEEEIEESEEEVEEEEIEEESEEESTEEEVEEGADEEEDGNEEESGDEEAEEGEDDAESGDAGDEGDDGESGDAGDASDE